MAVAAQLWRWWGVTNFIALWWCRWLYQSTNDTTHWQASPLLAKGRLGRAA
jgi:hypothetical protein